MAEDQDYDDILGQNVDEVRQTVRDLENPDYRKLLQLEREGKDRKTIKEFLEDRVEDSEPGTEEEEVEDTDEIIEEIEEETSGGLLGGFSRESVLAAGVVLGLVIGLVGGYSATMSDAPGQASPAEVQDSVSQLLVASGLEESQFEFTEVSQQNGMNYVSLNISQQTQNGTQTSATEFYVSPDAELLFRTQGPLGQSMVLNIQETIQQFEAQRQAQQNQTTGNTTQ